MKAVRCCMYALLGAMFTFVSCVDGDKDLSDPSKKHTSELDIPAGFEWESSQAVKLSVTSPVETTASFYSDESCTPESLIGTLPVLGGNKKTAFTFDLPFSQKAIYIQYPSKDGMTPVVSEIKQVGTRAVETNDIIFIEPAPSMSNMAMNIPNSGGYGTIMFEDTWPNTEDYDFNDVVVNYKIKCKLDPQSGNIDMDVSLKIRALGGTLPYNFAMQFGTWTSGAEKDRILAGDMVGISNVNSTNSEVSIEALNTKYLGVEVTGLNSLRTSGYYNTVSKEDNGVQIDFTVTIKGTPDQQWARINNGFGDPKAFDYFLRHEDGREIHMMGFAPTSLYAARYDADVQGKGGDIYYQSSKGLVWGLKAPIEIGWPAEKKDITSVYYRFAEWVTRGGSLMGNTRLTWYDYYTEENYIAN